MSTKYTLFRAIYREADTPPSLDTGIFVCEGQFTKPFDFKFYTRMVILDLANSIATLSSFYDSASLLGNLREIHLPDRSILKGEKLQKWQKERYNNFLVNPNTITEVSGITVGFRFERALPDLSTNDIEKTDVQRKIYLIGDSHISQVGNVCDPYENTQTPISFFASWITKTMEAGTTSVVFLGESTLVNINSESLPHSILGTCRWLEGTLNKDGGFKYVPWDVRWNVDPDLQSRIHECEKTGNFSTLINAFGNIRAMLNYSLEKFYKAYGHLLRDRSIRAIFEKWTIYRVNRLSDKYGNFQKAGLARDELFKFQRNGIHEGTAIMTDSYVIVQILSYYDSNIIFYGGTAHVATLYDFLYRFYDYHEIVRVENKGREICTDISGLL